MLKHTRVHSQYRDGMGMGRASFPVFPAGKREEGGEEGFYSYERGKERKLWKEAIFTCNILSCWEY